MKRRLELRLLCCLAPIFASLGVSGTALSQPCNDSDVIVLMEGSGKISAAEFSEMQNFLRTFVIPQSPGLRWGLRQYGDGDRAEVRLLDGLSAVRMAFAVLDANQLNAPGSGTAVELTGALNRTIAPPYETVTGGRDRVLLIVGENPPTDDLCGPGGDALRASLDNLNVRVIVVTAGRVSTDGDFSCLTPNPADLLVDGQASPLAFSDLSTLEPALQARFDAACAPTPTPVPSPSPTPTPSPTADLVPASSPSSLALLAGLVLVAGLFGVRRRRR